MPWLRGLGDCHRPLWGKEGQASPPSPWQTYTCGNLLSLLHLESHYVVSLAHPLCQPRKLRKHEPSAQCWEKCWAWTRKPSAPDSHPSCCECQGWPGVGRWRATRTPTMSRTGPRPARSPQPGAPTLFFCLKPECRVGFCSNYLGADMLGCALPWRRRTRAIRFISELPS